MEENNLPPGFRFHPTDEELITYYLNNKVSDFSFTSRAITDVDINKCEPWDLPAKASMGEKEWYFFNLKDRKYPTGLRTNRATEAGYWKTTGKDKEIFRGGVLIGMKKTLVFYRGRAPKGEKTNWVMHEYRQESKHAYRTTKEEWVVCRVFQKSTTVKKPQLQTSSSPQSLESPCDTNTIVNELCDIDQLQNTNDHQFQTPLLQHYNVVNNNDNMNFMNWTAQRDPITTLSSLAWPASSSLLNPNLSMNSWLLRALQLRNNYNQTREVNNNNDYISFMPQGFTHQHLGNDIMSSSFIASSSRVLDPDQQAPQPEEQPFDLDSSTIW